MRRPTARRSALLTTGVAGLALLGTGAPAWAYWTTESSDSALTAKAAAMGTPRAAVSAVITVKIFGLPVSGHLRFTAQAPTTGPAPLKYRVSRLNGSTVCEITPPATSCDGPTTLLPNILGAYRVVAVRHHWISRNPAYTSVLQSIFSNGLSIGLTPEFGGLAAGVGGSVEDPILRLGIPSSPVLVVSADSGAEGDSVTNAESVKMAGTADPGNTVVLFADGDEIGRGEVTDQGRYAIPVELGEGTHSVVAAAIRDGISSLTSKATAVVVDRTGPALQVVPTGEGKELELRGTAGSASGDKQKVTVKADNDAVVDETPAVDAAGTFVSAIQLKKGTTTVRVTQADAAGNETVRTLKLDRDAAGEPKPEKPKPEQPADPTPTPAPGADPTPEPTTIPGPAPEPTTTPTQTPSPDPTPEPTPEPGSDTPPTSSPGAKVEDEPSPADPAPIEPSDPGSGDQSEPETSTGEGGE